MSSTASFSQEQIRQLEQLAALREKGVLSDREFEDAKRALLSSTGPAPPGSLNPKQGRGLPLIQWLTLGVGILALILGLALCSKSSDEDSLADGEAIETNVVDVSSEPASLGDLCGSDETYSGIKDLIFDEAVKAYGGEPGPLNSLRRIVRVRMEVPEVKKIDEQLKRAECSGRAVIDLPPGVRQQFNNQRALEAEIEYSIQPAADKSGTVLTIEGAGAIIANLVGAATLVRSSSIASIGGPQLVRTYNPSFDCGRSLTNVERMVCQSEGLAALDRALSDRYFELRKHVSKTEWKMVLDTQREFLANRAKCAEEDCVRLTYIAQSRTLDQFDPNTSPSSTDLSAPAD